MSNFPQPIDKRFMQEFRKLQADVKRLQHLAADPVAIGTQLARTGLQSPGYAPGTGWALNSDGSGEISATVAQAGGGGIHVTIGPTAPSSPGVLSTGSRRFGSIPCGV